MASENKTSSKIKVLSQVWRELWISYTFSKWIQGISVMLVGLILLDFYDIPSGFLQKAEEYPPIVVVTVVTGICICMISWAARSLHMISVMKFKLVSWADSAFLMVAIVMLLYGIVRAALWEFKYIGVCAFAIAIFLMGCFIGRLLFLTKVKIDAERHKTNLVDLKDVYLNQFQYEPGAPIQIAETDVDYDLLDRAGIISQLFHAIVHCQPSKSYVISLEGKWGSGKTTILNAVIHQLRERQNNQIEVIDDFDPWLYGNQKALLEAMYSRLISGTGMRCNPHDSEQLLREILNACASEAANEFHLGRIANQIFPKRDLSADNIKKLKERINAYLQVNRKKFVFVIDNLDRADDDNIIFLFKVISLVFDFPGIIYVLSFERERIDDILKQTHALDHRFLEKIIQQEIAVPPMIGEQVQAVFYNCTKNLLLAYGVSQQEIAEFSSIYQYIINQAKDLRTFKRYLNSSLPVVFQRKTPLYHHDLFAIQAIHFFDPELYEIIQKKRKFFVSSGQSPDRRFSLGINKGKFNKEGNTFYEELNKNHEESFALLDEIFPYVHRYLDKLPLEPEYPSPDPDDILKNARICHDLYFDLYFTAGSNQYIRASKSVWDVVSQINAGICSTKISELLKNNLTILDGTMQRQWTEQFQLFLDDITASQAIEVVRALTSIYHQIDDSLVFLSLCARDRATFLITKLLSNCTIQELKIYADSMVNQYEYLRLVQGICYWLGTSQFPDAIKNERLPIFQDLYNGLCESILTQKVDLYNSEYYHSHNCGGLMFYCDTNKCVERCKEYYRSIISAENIYRILWDMTGCAMSGYYEYYVDEERLNQYIGDTQLVNSCIEQHGTLSDSEKFVKQVYDAFLSGEKRYDGRPRPIVSSEEMHVSL